jgi:hypothetical protein
LLYPLPVYQTLFDPLSSHCPCAQFLFHLSLLQII